MIARMRTTAADWAERVKAWRESGQTAPAFAEGKGFSDSLLRWWSTELVRRSRKEPRVRSVRVVRQAAAIASLTVSIGAARIEVRAGFDGDLLRGVVDALGGAR